MGRRNAPSRARQRAPHFFDALERRRLLAFAASVSGNAVVFTGGGDADAISIIEDSGLLHHDRFSVGEPGFASDYDFDTTTAGVQYIYAAQLTGLTINGGAGNDTVQLTWSAPNAPVTVNGDAGNDALFAAIPEPAIDFNGGLSPTDSDELHILSGTWNFLQDPSVGNAALTLRVASNAHAIFQSTQHVQSLVLEGGTATMADDGNDLLVVKSIQISDGGKLQIGNNGLIVDYDDQSPIGTWNGSEYTGLTGLVASGRNGGAWNGPGIITNQPSAQNTNDYTSIGVAEASESLGLSGSQTGLVGAEVVDATSVIVRYTYGSDVNLDGVVNVDDYGQLDFNGSTGGLLTGFFNGDVDYNGVFDVDDYGIIDFTISTQGQPIVPSAYTIASNVIEIDSSQPMTVSFTAGPGRGPLDWVGLFKVNSANERFGWWSYTNAAASGTFTLDAPEKGGNYEFRYLKDDGFTSVAISAPITVIAPPRPPPPFDVNRPSASNTGPTNPSALVFNAGVLEIHEPGVYENFDVVGGVSIYTSNVTLRNFVSRDNIKIYAGTNIVMEYGEVYSLTNSDGIGGSNMTLRRLNIHDVHDAVRIASDGNTLIEDCYIHDLGAGGGGHSDGIQTLTAVPNVIIRRNAIDAGLSTSCINGIADGWIVEDNWLYGGGFTIYTNFPYAVQSPNPIVRNNKLDQINFGAVRFWPVASGTWQNNTWHSTGEQIYP